MSFSRGLAVGLAMAMGAVAAACGSPDQGTADAGSAARAAGANGTQQTVDGDITAASIPAAITEPAVLRKLEAMGFGFGHHFGVPDAVSAQVLSTSSQYATIMQGIEANLDILQANDPKLDVSAPSHRLFDRAWLHSSLSHYALVAVTNRVDRSAAIGKCGETRFVYRLEYASARQDGATSRMPMTVAVVTPQTPRDGEPDCSSAMKRWLAVSGTGDAIAASLVAGPLAKIAPFITVETNIQAVRWPSASRKDIGGEAEYMLNVWRPTKDAPTQMEMAPLDNTPDTDAIGNDPKKQAALVAWVQENVSKIDHGIAHLPPELSAKTVYSYGPRGYARLANRPYSQLIQESDVRGVSFDGLTHVKSAFGLVRKLDEQSCQGCHQLRAMAGFHVLGNEDYVTNDDPLNRLVVGTSPHFNEELPWRRRLINAVAKGADPAALDEARPFAEHASNDGQPGASCGLGGDATFASWTCQDGQTCLDMVGEGKVGACTTLVRQPGESCTTDRISTSADPTMDTVENLDDGNSLCDSGTPGTKCDTAALGFPGGACTGVCPHLGVMHDRVICGVEPKDGFNTCMQDHTKSFDECMGPPGQFLRQACSLTLPCRDDYMCAFVPKAPAGYGACMPPYFIFEARLDGHD